MIDFVTGHTFQITRQPFLEFAHPLEVLRRIANHQWSFRHILSAHGLGADDGNVYCPIPLLLLSVSWRYGFDLSANVKDVWDSEALVRGMLTDWEYGNLCFSMDR